MDTIPPMNPMGHRFIFVRQRPDGSHSGLSFIDDLRAACVKRKECIDADESFQLWEHRGRKMYLRKSGRLPAK